MANIFSGIMEGLQFSDNKKRQAKADDFEQHRAAAEDAIRQTQLKYEGQRIEQSAQESAQGLAFDKEKQAATEKHWQEETDRKAKTAASKLEVERQMAGDRLLSQDRIAATRAALTSADSPEGVAQIAAYYLDKLTPGQIAAEPPKPAPQTPSPGLPPTNTSIPTPNLLQGLLGGAGAQGGAVHAAPQINAPAMPMMGQPAPPKFDPSKPFGGVKGATQAHLNADTAGKLETAKLTAAGVGLKDSETALNATKSLVAKDENKRANDKHPMDLLLEQAKINHEKAGTNLEVAQTSHALAETRKAKAEIDKIRQETHLSRENEAIMSHLSAKLGPELASYIKGNEGGVLKLKTDAENQFMKVSTATEALRKERDALQGKIALQGKQFAALQGLSAGAAKSSDHTAWDGKENVSQAQIGERMQAMLEPMISLTGDAKVLTAHLAEMETMRTDAKKNYETVRDALQSSGAVNVAPSSVAIPKIKVGNKTLPANQVVGKTAEQLSRMQGKKPGVMVRGPGSQKAAPKKKADSGDAEYEAWRAKMHKKVGR